MKLGVYKFILHVLSRWAYMATGLGESQISCFLLLTTGVGVQICAPMSKVVQTSTHITFSQILTMKL